MQPPMQFLVTVVMLMRGVRGHGSLTLPTSTRHGGSLASAGHCDNDACMWFSQPTAIPGGATLPAELRSYNVGIDGGSCE